MTYTPEQLTEIVNRMSEQVRSHETQLAPARNGSLLTQRDAEQRYGPAAMRKHLSSAGSHPLSVDGLKGKAADTQRANIPTVVALPQGGAQVEQGTTLKKNGVTYIREGTQWVPISGR